MLGGYVYDVLPAGRDQRGEQVTGWIARVLTVAGQNVGAAIEAGPLLPAIVTLSLTACATAPSRPSIVCPPVVTYDRNFQARLADEIQRLPPGAALERAMLDYARLRDQEWA
jgi:hypothetical protein